MTLWSLGVGVNESRTFCLLMVNHTDDPELKEMIEHFIADVETPMAKKVSEVMLNEGMTLPMTTGDKPSANEAAVPPGAKLTDHEIAHLLVVKYEGMLTLCHLGLIQSLRPDLSRMYYAFQSHLLAQGFTLKNLMKKRGWLQIPPYYRPQSAAERS